MILETEAKEKPEAEPHPWELGKNRIEALSDGIFAIAMTLLVLNFHIPNLPHDAPNVRVLPALLRMWPVFATYAVSFLSLGVFWIGHHNMYHAVRRSDRTLLWLSILFFMFVSSLPFTTSVLNAFPKTQVAPLFFGANLTLIGWLLYIQWAYAGRQPEMLAAFVTGHHRRVIGRRFLAYPVVATLTMLICFWSIPISLGLYLLLLPLLQASHWFSLSLAGRRSARSCCSCTKPLTMRFPRRFIPALRQWLWHPARFMASRIRRTAQPLCINCPARGVCCA